MKSRTCAKVEQFAFYIKQLDCLSLTETRSGMRIFFWGHLGQKLNEGAEDEE
jgi:hypothetical protein